MSQLSASAVLRHASTAALLITGRVPGMPRQISHTLEFGGAPPRAPSPSAHLLLPRVGSHWTADPDTSSQRALRKCCHLRPFPPCPRLNAAPARASGPHPP